MNGSDQWVTLARIERSRGRFGEVVTSEAATDALSFVGRAVTLVDRSGLTRPAKVQNAWLHGGRLVLQLEGVATIDEAEKLRGWRVCVPRTERPPAGEGEYYFADLIGCQVVDHATGAPIGEVTGWSPTGAVPLMEVRGPRGEVLVPFARQLLAQVDLGARTIRVSLPEGLLDLNDGAS